MNFPVDELEPDLGVVRVEGRLNMVTATQLKDTVTEAVGTGKLRLVVDLTSTTFMDSSGLGALIGALKTARAAGGDLRIAGANEQVLMVLQLSNMDRILRPYGTPEAAFGS
ncbi:STAS domain-containing protein [Propionicimonas sp.]|uniref:STAS domain-containing protein n=1 Tax=Propionicimonas sp. TaxID=1955623 RepID=UPI0017CE23D6|nr:STAS domain-containing protein [Propionicimonas sp.]MBU3978023.1 STAS domain-containing protein [Actinomycetota bacterium]MBA3021755.1 STAS domain-containing protein [Propionicimonas sp.]MBU3985467.1 STAS domain-containing protein [Actinomycetota bacterium]MBU4007562.1 STAS domain-containing protein [Actinomycetota bacterium]MBU4066544.1 STAS domain-containing protein [Actinomycetota bacterium]